jgi:ribosomal protein L25 (general stress protein Ctc)
MVSGLTGARVSLERGAGGQQTRGFALRRPLKNVKIWTPPFDLERSDHSKIVSLKASRRGSSGSRESRKLRGSGQLPGHVLVNDHGGGVRDNKHNLANSFNVTLDYEEVLKEVQKGYFLQNLFKLEIEGEVPNCSLCAVV